MKKEINAFEYANEIFKALPQGILLVSEAEDCVNAMTIGWAMIGIEWGVPIFTVYVREDRFTRELLDRTGEFTICVPYGEKYSDKVKKALGICGSRSGRDMDKIAKSGLTVVDAEIVRPPAIKEFPLTIECRAVFQKIQPVKEIAYKFSKFYPADKLDEYGGAHIAYYGEILKSYIIEE